MIQYPQQTFRNRRIQHFSARRLNLYYALVRAPHVQNPQEVVHLTAYFIVTFLYFTYFTKVAAIRIAQLGGPRVRSLCFITFEAFRQ